MCIRDRHYMFHYASAFSQDLNWCVGDDVNLDEAFSGTPCASTSCGVKIRQFETDDGSCGMTPVPTAYWDGVHHVDDSIRRAVAAWLADKTAAEATYGHISTWETAGVTDMSYLFCGLNWPSFGCYSAAASFNEDIGAWDTSGVTTMYLSLIHI